MALDASIYSNVKAPETDVPDPTSYAEKSMRLSQLGMQQMQISQQMQTQAAVKTAYAKNTDPDSGQLNRGGFLSDLHKTAPIAASDYDTKFAEQDKQAAEAKNAQMVTAHQTLSVSTPALQYLLQLPDDQAAKAFPGVMSQLKAQGVPMDNAPPEWDRGWAKQGYEIGSKMKEGLENQLTAAQTGKTISETGQVEKEAQTNYQKMLGENDVYKKATGMLSEGKNAMANIDDAVKNPGSAANVPIMLARFTSAGSRMNENEIEANVKAGAFGDQIQQMYTKTRTGVLSPKMADYARQFLNTQMASASQNKADATTDIAGKYASARGLPKEIAYNRLTGEQPGGAAQVPPQSTVVDNRAPSGGGTPIIRSANASEKPQSNYRAVGSSVSADEVAKYATTHKMKLSDAQSYLRGLGYATGR